MSTVSTAPAQTADETELERVLRKTLAASGTPLSANQVSGKLTGPFRRPRKELQRILEEMVERGHIHQLGRYGGTERYWDRRPEEYARELTLAKLTESPLTRSELHQAVKAELRAVSKHRQDEILRELIRSGAVRELPPYIGARTKRLSARPADPRDYVEYAIQKVCGQLAKNGISEAQVHAAALDVLGKDSGGSTLPEPSPAQPQPELGGQRDGRGDGRGDVEGSVQELVLARVMELPQGAMVPIAELRQGLDFQDRAEVDRAIWELVRGQVVAVHKHHHPASLSEAERAHALIDQQGNLYHGISRRSR